MRTITIKRGLDVPITGAPTQQIHDGPKINSVAIIGYDYAGMKPTMLVKPGDSVKLGQVLFTDKKNPAVRFTAPGSGTVTAVNRGAKRRLESVVIELGGGGEEQFPSVAPSELAGLAREQVEETLLASGLWTALRTRPMGKVPAPGTVPHSIFVTALDTNPLAPNARLIIGEDQEAFSNGLTVVARLTAGQVFVCQDPGAELPGGDLPSVTPVAFKGPHPAGLAGTHIHYLDPVDKDKTVWHVGYQDIIAIGKLFVSGKISVERVISLAGPAVREPRLIRTRLGANTDDLVAGQLAAGDNRVIAGSVLSGRTATGPTAYLGRYPVQVTALAEGGARTLFGWTLPGAEKFSVRSIFLSALMPGKRFAFTTAAEGGPRAVISIGSYEKVMPLDISPVYLLKSLIIDDTDEAQALGCLELEEEDLALCTYVCPGKYEYGPILRRNLELIEKEG